MNSDLTMNPTQLATGINRSLDNDVPFFVWGAPGVGKSDIIRQVAADRALDICDIRAVTCDPMDLRGLPYVRDGIATWASPSFLPTSGSGLIFLDELSQAPTLVQSACLQLVLDRRLGEYVVPAGWAICAAGNRETDHTGSNTVISSLLNRFAHFTLEPDIDCWARWAARTGVHNSIRAFLIANPTELSPKPIAGTKAFATPRTWEMASSFCDQREWDLIAATVGIASMTKLQAFCRLSDSDDWPVISDWLENPVPFRFTNPSLCFAVLLSITDKLRGVQDMAQVDHIVSSIMTGFSQREYWLAGIMDAIEVNSLVAHCIAINAFVRDGVISSALLRNL